MTVPPFVFDYEANAWMSSPFEVKRQADAYIELQSSAPVLTMRTMKNGSLVVYGQTPQESDNYKLRITTNRAETIVIATPVPVRKCYVVEL